MMNDEKEKFANHQDAFITHNSSLIISLFLPTAF
jgi:hypothetical protein